MNTLKLNIKIVWRTFSANATAISKLLKRGSYSKVQDYYFVTRIYDQKRRFMEI